MITIQDTILLPVTKQDIEEAVKKALEDNFIDNLRERDQNVQLDCKIRGYIGEIVLKKWFNTQGIKFEESNVDEDGVNIDLLYKGKNPYNIEVKTSLIPDNYKDLKSVIEKCDVKLIKRTTHINNLKGDIHIQIYFDQLTVVTDTWLNSVVLKDFSIEEIIKTLNLEMRYMNKTYFVAWIDKPTLISQINSKPYGKIWSFGMRDFWTCNIESEAKRPKDIIPYLQSL